MCSMCAAAAVAAASGTRSWLATQSWLTPRLLRVVTISLAVVGLAVSSVRFSGSSQPTPHHAPPPTPVAQR